MHLGSIGGYIITTGGGYSAPLKQHRENPAVMMAGMQSKAEGTETGN